MCLYNNYVHLPYVLRKEKMKKDSFQHSSDNFVQCDPLLLKEIEIKELKKIKCYVSSRTRRMKRCKVCEESLISKQYFLPQNIDPQLGKYCTKCEMFHIAYATYMKCPDLWIPTNIDNIEMIRAVDQKRKLKQKARRKRRKEAKKKQRQEAKKKQEKEINRKEDTNYWRIRFTNTERVVYSEKSSKQVKKEEDYLPEWIKRAAEEEREKRLKKEHEEMRRRIDEMQHASEYDTTGLYYVNNNTTVQKVGEIKNPDSININKESNKDIITTITGQNFVVRCNTFKCRYYNHYVQDIVAVITTVSRSGTIRELQIPAGYCVDCKTYFILDTIFKRIQNAGVPICKVMNKASGYKDSYYEDYEYGFNLKPESILMHYGYNVNQTDDLSPEARRNILAAMIDYKVLTRNDILSHLNFLISMNQKKDDKDTEGTRRMANAISKWKADRLFVEKYEIGTVKKVPIRSIITNK